jgi:hypothetical protein
MEPLPKKIYTCEFKLEAIQLVESGQSVAETAFRSAWLSRPTRIAGAVSEATVRQKAPQI